MNQLQSGLTLDYNVTVEVHDAQTGELRERQYHHNITTTAGLNLVRDLLHGGATHLTHFALGTGGTAPTVGDTTLAAEVFRDIITQRIKGVQELTLKYYLSSGSANGETLQEAGLFNASSAGSMFARTLFTPVAKDATTTVTFTWVLSFS